MSNHFFIYIIRHSLLLAYLSLFCGLSNLTAQAPAPLPSPNLDVRAAGYVLSMARLPDGGTIVGGEFTSVYDPATQLSFDRQNLAKFSATGALDLAWTPHADGPVHALAVDGEGSVFVAGAFGNINGQPRGRIAKISTSGVGEIIPDWTTTIVGTPSAESIVLALAFSGQGALYVGGAFSSIGGQARQNIAKLSATTGLADPVWNPSPECPANAYCVRSIALGAGESVFVGGDFSAIGGLARSNIAKLNGASSGAALPDWSADPVNGTVLVVAIAPDDSVYVGGNFSQIGGQSRLAVAKLSGLSGNADAGWISQSTVYPQAIALSSGNKVYLGGSGGVARVSSADGGADPGWGISLTGGAAGVAPVRSISVNPDGVVTVGGTFGRANGQPALALARVSAEGTLLATAHAQSVGNIYGLARGADGSLFVAGDFERVGNHARTGLFKLTPGGDLDIEWNPSPVGKPQTIKATASGAIIVAGSFESIGGQNIAYLARLSASGSGAADSSWNPAPNGPVAGLAVDTGNNVYVAGGFSSIGNQAITALAKVTPAGNVDPAWNFDPTCGSFYFCVSRLAVDSTGSVYAGGNFTGLGGLFRNGLAKISPAGVVDPNWNPAPLCEGFCISALEPDALGNLYVAGNFTSIGGQPLSRLARVSRNGIGEADSAWNPAPNGEVRALRLDHNGSVYISGFFSAVGGQARSTMAKLSTLNTGFALDGWDPSPSGGFSYVGALELSAAGAIYAGGSYAQIGGAGRLLLAALPPTADPVFGDGFE